jgi:hypothetical protein
VTRSHLLYRSALVDYLAIYFIFSKPYCIFYAFLNFTRFSGNVQEIEKFKKKWGHSGPALAHGPGIVGPTRKPFLPAGVLGRRDAAQLRGHHAQRA